LSLPWIRWDVERPEKVVVKYQDVNGKYHTLTAKWYNAAIIQHEIDHLDGILFIDKVKDFKAPDLSKLIKS